MTCTTWNESLTGRLYGEITADDDAALTAHLESCENCRLKLDEFQRVRHLLREDEAAVARVPRVLVLRDRSRFRPALMAASLLGAAVLAGAGAGAGYALGRGHVPASPAVAITTPGSPAVSTEELVRREVDRRMAAVEAARSISSAANAGSPASATPADRPVSSSALKAELAKLERRVSGERSADLDYVLDQIAASEVRVASRIGKTNQALRSVALASNPRIDAQ